MAAYQANYGFTEQGEPDANNTAVSSTDSGPQPPVGKLPNKEKPGGDAQCPAPEASTKEAKQKGEKRKAEPGRAVLSIYCKCDAPEVIVLSVLCLYFLLFCLQGGLTSTTIKTQTSMCQVRVAKTSCINRPCIYR